MTVRTGSRGGGQSARACAAYIEREEEYGRAADTAAELVYTESGHMPAWANAEAGALAYWDAADLYERRNGRLYKSIEIALPLALDPDQQRALAVQFAHSLTDADQLPYTLALHAGKGENPHCHLMISERANDQLERSPAHWFKRYNAAEPEAGGAQKSTALKPKEWLLETRAAWAAQTNAALQEAGLALRIDHRSLEAQGIERVPGIHLGPAAAAMEARGELSERGNRQAEINQLNEQLTALEKEIEYERQRQRDLEPRAVQAEAHRAAEAEHPARAAALEPAHRDAERADGGAERRAAGRPERERGVAAGDHRAARGALPRGGAADRAASAERGGGLEAGAGRLAGRTDRAEQLPERLGPPSESASRGAGEAARGADMGLDPRGVGGVRGGGVPDPDAGRVRGGDLREVRAVEQDSRAVDAAAVATAQAQLVAAEAAIEEAAQQLAEAGARLERQAEQQRARERERVLQEREKRWERERNQGAEWER